MELPGGSKKGRPQRRFMDIVREGWCERGGC